MSNGDQEGGFFDPILTQIMIFSEAPEELRCDISRLRYFSIQMASLFFRCVAIFFFLKNRSSGISTYRIFTTV